MYEVLINLPRHSKRQILLCVDMIVAMLALYSAFALRFGTIHPDFAHENALIYFSGITFLSLCLLLSMRLSQVKLESFERTAILRTGICAIGLAVICSIISFFTGFGTPRSIPIIFGFLFFVGSVSSRILGQVFLEYLSDHGANRKRVLVYGAGQAGIQLVSALRQTKEIRPVVFVDDNTTLKGLIVSGLLVMPADKIEEIIVKLKIDQVILAMPSMGNQQRVELLKKLSDLECEVQTLPSFMEMIDGRGLVESLKPVSADDLLGRDKVDLDLPEVARAYSGKSVMVTGAGGSIGSELCRQLISCGIQKLTLYEHSEFALYTIEVTTQHGYPLDSLHIIRGRKLVNKRCFYANLSTAIN